MAAETWGQQVALHRLGPIQERKPETISVTLVTEVEFQTLPTLARMTYVNFSQKKKPPLNPEAVHARSIHLPPHNPSHPNLRLIESNSPILQTS
jgi:hypothetical protein